MHQDSQSAGVRVWHYLMQLVGTLGYQLSDKEGVAIYPDCIPGNPLNAENVVHFWLYYPQAYWGSAMVPKDRLVLIYHNRFRDQAQAQYEGVIPQQVFTMPSIEPGVFYPDQYKPIGAVWHIGKGDPRNLPMNHSPYLIRKTSPDRGTVIQWLRRCRQFLTLDDCTITSTEAALCGAHTFLWKDGQAIPNPIADPQSMVMKPERDLELAYLFAEEIRKFFNL